MDDVDVRADGLTAQVRTGRDLSLPVRAALSIVAAVVFLVALGLTTSGLYATGNLLNLGQVVSILGIVTIGQMIVMVGGGLDLSVGATAGLAFFAIASVSHGENARILPALLVTFGLAIAIGLLNAFLVVQRDIPPFVATLGTLIVIKGVVSAWSHGVFQGSVPAGLRGISTHHVGPISLSLVVLLIVSLLSAFALGQTVFGQHLYATGLNELAAAYAGVRIGLVRSATYVISAVLAALAGLLLGAYTGFVDPTAGLSLNLESVAAAVVGGVSLLGGRGRTLNAVLGAVLMTVVLNVGLLHGLSGQSQFILTGVVLLLAALLYGVRGRRRT
jgi:ribose/xylose/arabinose/galactoside ABC-type transport system permease subunit